MSPLPPQPRPRLITFDVFGTILDWQRGMTDDVHAAGRSMGASDFERVVNRQAELERERHFHPDRDITAALGSSCLAGSVPRRCRCTSLPRGSGTPSRASSS